MAAQVAHELITMGDEVTVVGTENCRLLGVDMHDFGSPIFDWRDQVAVENFIAKSDECIFHIGNSFEFHRGGIYWLEKKAGIVCLHDFFLGNLFHSWSAENGNEANLIIKNIYGEDAVDKFFIASSKSSFIQDLIEIAPMTEWICSQACAVVTHSELGCDRVLVSCPGAVRIVPLAYKTEIQTPKSYVHNKKVNQKFKMLSFGQVNENKRIRSVIEAIGKSPMLRNSCEYVVVGLITQAMERDLLKLATQFGVEICIRGEVCDLELQNALTESDLVCCLRWPATETASASAIEAMQRGRPIVVTDVGFYKNIPSNCAIKINPQNEIEELKSALERLLADDEYRHSIADAATKWATETFTAKNYALELQAMIRLASFNTPIINAINFFSRNLKIWTPRLESSAISTLSRQCDFFDFDN